MWPLALLWIAFSLTANTNAVLEPEDIGAPFLLQSGDSPSLKPLETRRGMSGTRTGLFNGREIIEIPLAASPVRFPKGAQLEFVVRCLLPVRSMDRQVLMIKDPTNFELYRLNSDRGKNIRELIFTQRGFINSNGSFGFFLYVRQHGENSFRLRPSETLPPGEYAIKYGLTPQEAKELHCFGIDD
jgi:hypothetical protein